MEHPDRGQLSKKLIAAIHKPKVPLREFIFCL